LLDDGGAAPTDRLRRPVDRLKGAKVAKGSVRSDLVVEPPPQIGELRQGGENIIDHCGAIPFALSLSGFLSGNGPPMPVYQDKNVWPLVLALIITEQVARCSCARNRELLRAACLWVAPH